MVVPNRGTCANYLRIFEKTSLSRHILDGHIILDILVPAYIDFGIVHDGRHIIFMPSFWSVVYGPSVDESSIRIDGECLAGILFLVFYNIGIGL